MRVEVTESDHSQPDLELNAPPGHSTLVLGLELGDRVFLYDPADEPAENRTPAFVLMPVAFKGSKKVRIAFQALRDRPILREDVIRRRHAQRKECSGGGVLDQTDNSRQGRQRAEAGENDGSAG